MLLLRILSISLFVGLAAWIAFGILAPVGTHPAPSVLGLGNAFEGNLQLPAETIRKAFDAARQRMLDVNDRGSAFRWAGDIAGWLSFAATALITLIVGFHGRPPAPNGTPAATEGLPARSVRLIGLLAAVAAVLTAAGNLSVAKSQEHFKRADEIRDLIAHDRAQVVDAKTADAAQAILDDLAVKVAR